MAPKAALDLSSLDAVVKKWNDAKKREQEAHKEIEACKTQIEAAMMKTGVEVIKTSHFEVTKRMQSRESVSKADLPKDIFEKYKKTSTFAVLSCKESKAGGKEAAPKAKAKAKGSSKPTKK
eukprot:TRINITY_DN111899_c0_g1_i1.p1 TRINITY_DN111899_c0_g1~~TRINITY_DN111899_c0_g1_i1.p1  ORF type:complete len:121 (-),score=44.34 TRINITY_DN111899_c0_g1_i1:150-512(-)